MAIFALSLTLALALTAVPVRAGCQAWESSVTFALTEKLAADPTALDEGNATHINRKRYITIKPGADAHQNRHWPKGVITYCFETKTWPERGGKSTREILFEDLRNARDLWYQAGLPESFDWKEGSSDFCKDPSKRPDFLLIRFNTEGKLATTPGVPPRNEDSLNVGPRMMLSDATDVGMLNIVSNYAHEMGVSGFSSPSKQLSIEGSLLTR